MQDKSNNNSRVPVSPVDVTSEVTQACPTPVTPWTAACGLLCAGVFQVRTLEGVAARPADKCSPQSFLPRGAWLGGSATSSSLFSGLKAALSRAVLELRSGSRITENTSAMSAVCVCLGQCH